MYFTEYMSVCQAFSFSSFFLPFFREIGMKWKPFRPIWMRMRYCYTLSLVGALSVSVLSFYHQFIYLTYSSILGCIFFLIHIFFSFYSLAAAFFLLRLKYCHFYPYSDSHTPSNSSIHQNLQCWWGLFFSFKIAFFLYIICCFK